MVVAVVDDLIALAYEVRVVHFVLKLRVEVDVLCHKIYSTDWTGVYEGIRVSAL
jgi:hypothetical protein